MDPPNGSGTPWAWLIWLALAYVLTDTTERKSPHNIMASINVTRYAFVLMGKYPYAYDTQKCIRSQ